MYFIQIIYTKAANKATTSINSKHVKAVCLTDSALWDYRPMHANFLWPA